MDHPLLSDENSDLRKRVIQLIRTGFDVRKAGNIVFVCGGNGDTALRSKFIEYCQATGVGFELFKPEYAMKSYFSEADSDQFDISSFEELVAELSHAIVLFPEAAGSFAEVGYFSAIKELSKKTILALDADQQRDDSFISLGPAKRIAEDSLFHPNIQISYAKPKFDDIIERVNRIAITTRKKYLKFENFNTLSNYEKYCVIYTIVSILSIATIDDILYIVRALSRAQASPTMIRKLTSILVGSGWIFEVGQFGHYTLNSRGVSLLEPHSGWVSENSSIRIALSGIYERGDESFQSILEGIQHAG